jgi:hypothetical protein
MLKRGLIGSAALSLLLLGACNRPTSLDDTKLRDSDQETSNWLMYGRTYEEQKEFGTFSDCQGSQCYLRPSLQVSTSIHCHLIFQNSVEYYKF